MCCQNLILFKLQTLRTSIADYNSENWVGGKKTITISLESVQLDRKLSWGTQLAGLQVCFYGILEILCQEILFSSNEFTFLSLSTG